MNSPFPTPPADNRSDVNFISFPFQVATLSITCSIIFSVIYFTIYQEGTVPLEKQDRVLPLTPQIFRDSGSEPTTVKTGLVITDFKKFDIMNNSFIFDGTIWFEFDQALVSLETISNFDFKEADIKYKSAPRTHAQGNLIAASYDITVDLNNNLKFQFFPLDDHIISILLLNKSASIHEIQYQSYNQDFIIDTNVLSYGWAQKFKSVITGYTQKTLDVLDKNSQITTPATQFSIYYHRSGIKYVLIILMPMFVFIILMILAFSFDPEKNFNSIMVTNGASLSGLIGFRFVIENISPKVSYFMISDYFFFIFLTIATLLFLIGIFSLKITMRTKKILLLLIHFIIIGCFITVAYHIAARRIYVSEIKFKGE